MRKMELDHYYLTNNEIDISLSRYFVNVKLFIDDEETHFLLTIINNDQEELIFRFDTLEDTISFIEDIVYRSKDFFEIIEGYEFYKMTSEKKRLLRNKDFN